MSMSSQGLKLKSRSKYYLHAYIVILPIMKISGPSSEKYSVNYKKEEYFHFNVEGWLTLLIINGLLFSLQFCFFISLYTG